MIVLSLLLAVVAADRFVYGGKQDKSAWIASYANDPTKKGDNDLIVFATGTKGFWGNVPPYVFVGHAKGSVDMDLLSDMSNLFNRKVQIDEAAGMLYLHYGLGEFCDIDGQPGFGGSWPPKFGDLIKTYFNVVLSKEKFANDTFLTAADWTTAKFQDLVTGDADKQKFTEIKTENGPAGKPIYKMKCHSSDASATTKGLKIGEFRFKCDFTLAPDKMWVDQAMGANDPNLLLGGKTTIENLGENKGCTPDKRKIALLAFLAGASIKDDVDPMSNAKEWKTIPVGGAEFAFVTSVSILDKDDKDTGRTAAVNAQIKPLSDIIDTSSFPKFLKTTKAILFTFEASRADLMNGESIFFDPTFGYASNPNDPTATKSSASMLSLAVAVLTFACALLF